jgi:hypothetical protein
MAWPGGDHGNTRRVGGIGGQYRSREQARAPTWRPRPREPDREQHHDPGELSDFGAEPPWASRYIETVR